MGNKILRVIERVLCVSVCCCKKWSKEPLKRGRRRRIFLYLKSFSKIRPHTQKRKKTSLSFYLPSQNLTLALFALAVFTHALLRRRFDRDHFFKSFDDDVCSFFWTERALLVFFVMFLFFSFFFPSTLDKYTTSHKTRVVNNCISIVISITRRRDDNHDGHRR